jgi:hypothetical protein
MKLTIAAVGIGLALTTSAQAQAEKPLAPPVGVSSMPAQGLSNSEPALQPDVVLRVERAPDAEPTLKRWFHWFIQPKSDLSAERTQNQGTHNW